MIHCFYCSDNNEMEENNNGMEYLLSFVNIYPNELLPNTITMKWRKITMKWRKITMKWSICTVFVNINPN